MILFIDDERRFMNAYREELEMEGYDVSFVNRVDDAAELFDTHTDSIRLVILDVMMPPGSIFRGEDTRNGLLTGVRFYERIRDLAPRLPVLIFTNVSDEGLEQRFRDETDCWFLHKYEYLPHELAETVKEILSSGHP